MKRILSLVLAMVMVLGSFSAVFAAELTAAEKAGAFLKEVDVLRGTTDSGDLDLEEDLRREEAIVVLSRLMGVEETAKGFPTEGLKFTDITNEGYKGYIQWAYANGYTTGKSDVKFGFKEALTAQHFATFILRALGYDVTGEDYVKALETAKDLGILGELELENKTELKRGMMAVMTFNALSVNVKDSEKTLAETLEIVMPVVEPEVPAALEVKEVVANNLKSFTVVFNQAVESAKVAVKGNTVTLKLAEDKMSAVGYYGTVLAQSASVEFTINAETEAGLELKDLKVTKIVADTVVPTVLGAKALNGKQIEIQFSEPVVLSSTVYSLFNDIKLGGNAIVATATSNFANNTVVFELATALKEGSYDLEVAKVKDYANFVAPTATFSILVIEDKAAPIAIAAEVINKDEVVVTFNESLKSIGTYTVNTKAAAPSFVADSNDTKVRLALSESLGIGAIIEVKVAYKGQTDIMGNAVTTESTITTKTEDDSTLPTVVLTSVEAGNKVTLTFSKSMLIDPNGKFTVLNKDGSVKTPATPIISGDYKTDTSNTVLVLTATRLGLTGVDAADYSIKLTGMKDATIRTNPLAETTLEFKALDTKTPVVLTNYIVTDGAKADGSEDTITIYFSEAMDTASITNLANYLDGSVPFHVNGAVTKVVAAADAKSVTITYTNARSFAIGKTLTVLGVKDVAGNPVAPTPISRLNPTATELKYNGLATVVDENTIEVVFNTPIASVHPSLLTLYKGSDAVTGFSAATAKVVGGTYVVSFTSPVALEADASVYHLTVNVASAITNIYGQTLTKAGGVAYTANEALTATIADGIAPTLVKVETGTATDRVKFTFSEPIVMASGKGTFDAILTVKNADGTINTVTRTVYAGTNVWEVAFAGLSGKTIEVGFPTVNGHIIDNVTANNPLLPTGWFKVTVK